MSFTENYSVMYNMYVLSFYPLYCCDHMQCIASVRSNATEIHKTVCHRCPVDLMITFFQRLFFI